MGTHECSDGSFDGLAWCTTSGSTSCILPRELRWCKELNQLPGDRGKQCSCTMGVKKTVDTRATFLVSNVSNSQRDV